MSKLGFEGYNLLKPHPTHQPPNWAPQVGSGYNLQKPKKPPEPQEPWGAFSIGGPKICHKILHTVGLEPEAIQWESIESQAT